MEDKSYQMDRKRNYSNSPFNFKYNKIIENKEIDLKNDSFSSDSSKVFEE